MSKLKTQNYNSNLKSNLRYRAYKFSLTIIKFVSSLRNDRVLNVIKDQLLRSTTSIGANLVEAKSVSSKKDFIRFYEIALKSANETKYWLGLLRDAELVSESKINLLLEEVNEISNMIGSSLLTLKKKKIKY